MSDEEARLRRQVSLLGEESLNRLDKWRWKQMEQADERKRYIARQERIEQERAAAAAAADEVAELRRQFEALRAAHNENINIINANLKVIDKTFDAADERAAKQDDTIKQLGNQFRSEIAELKTKFAEARVAELETLHASLTRSAELSMKAFEQAAERAALSTAEWDQVAEVGAKANELAAELQRLREAQKNFRFSRELDQDDFITDLPAG